MSVIMASWQRACHEACGDHEVCRRWRPERFRREQVRLATRLIEAGRATGGTRRYRIPRMSANRWRRTLAAGGSAALMSRGVGGARCMLTEARLGELEASLEADAAWVG
jgi:putative transposase